MGEKDEDGLGAGSIVSCSTSYTWESPLSLSGLQLVVNRMRLAPGGVSKNGW